MGWLTGAAARLRASIAGRRQGLRALAAVAVLTVLAAVVLGVVGWIGSERAIHPGPPEEVATLAEYPLPVEEVVFPSRDGTRLSGWFVPADGAGGEAAPGAPAVVLLHGYGDRRESVLPHASFLHRAGYHVLLFDFRATGRSEGDAVTVGALEQLDAQGALDYLHTRDEVDRMRIALHGVSMGAAVAIMTAAREVRAAAVVAEASFTDLRSTIDSSFEHFIGLPAFPFGPITTWITERRLGIDADSVSPLRDVPALAGRPLFIIENELDGAIAPDSGVALFQAAGQPKRYWLAPDSAHGQGHRDARAQYERRVREFLHEALRSRARRDEARHNATWYAMSGWGGAQPEAWRQGILRVVGDTGLEPVTSAMSTQRSSQLS